MKYNCASFISFINIQSNLKTAVDIKYHNMKLQVKPLIHHLQIIILCFTAKNAKREICQFLAQYEVMYCNLRCYLKMQNRNKTSHKPGFASITSVSLLSSLSLSPSTILWYSFFNLASSTSFILLRGRYQNIRKKIYIYKKTYYFYGMKSKLESLKFYISFTAASIFVLTHSFLNCLNRFLSFQLNLSK